MNKSEMINWTKEYIIENKLKLYIFRALFYLIFSFFFSKSKLKLELKLIIMNRNGFHS